MSIDLKQTAGCNVKPIDDARLFEFMSQGKTGIVEGVEITHLGANQLKVSSGWGICQGRMFEITEETINAQTSANGELKGRLVLNIDTSADVPATFITQAAASLPALTQEDINGSGTVYQMPLAEYTIDELTISALVSVTPRIVADVSAKTVGGYWFDKTDADGNPTDEIYIHWYEDENGNVVSAIPIT